jgi:hypothetical protein
VYIRRFCFSSDGKPKAAEKRKVSDGWGAIHGGAELADGTEHVSDIWMV